MRQSQAINIISIKKKVGGNFSAALAIAARALLDKNNNVQVDPDDLPGTLRNLTQASGALLYLTSPNGTKFALTVSNGGQLSIAQQ